MKPIDWNIIDEWQPLEAVMVGIGAGMGEAPALDETYDPLSRRHVLAGTYPKEEDVKKELNAFARTLEGREIRVLRPDSLGINQVFTRDIGVIIDDTFIMTHMVEDRVLEQKGLHSMLNRNPGLVKHPPDHVLLVVVGGEGAGHGCFTSAIMSQTASRSRSFGPRQAAPMQNRVAPESFARRAAARTASSDMSLSAPTSASLWALCEQ